jgi:hypothetical protein
MPIGIPIEGCEAALWLVNVPWPELAASYLVPPQIFSNAKAVKTVLCK